MSDKSNKLIFHSTVSKPNSLAIDVDIARSAGFDGIETMGNKIGDFLNAGFSEQELKGLVSGLDLPGIGFLINLERQGEERSIMLREAETLCHLAAAIGAKGIEAITGPLDVSVFEVGSAAGSGIYRGLIDLDIEEQMKMTALNLAAVADIAVQHGLLVYLEALAWTPLNTMDRQMRVIDACRRDNVKVVIDFWHSHASGDGPERIARMDRGLIYGVHFCDSLYFGGGIPNEGVLRDVPTGKGVLNLPEWVSAVKATGYDDWWSCELFCKRQQQDNSYAVARDLKDLMASLIL